MRGFAGKLLLAVCSAAATWIAVDLMLLLRNGPVRAVEDFYEPDPRFGYRMRPDLQFEFASPYRGYRATVRTNSRGLRDAEIAIPKPPGVFRILLLGDSMTAGLEVEREQTFEAVCEERLRAFGPVEVVNAGVRGYNLDNIVGFMASEGDQYEPDVVVYLFVDNDLVTEASYSPAGSDISRGFTLHGLLGRMAAYSHLTYRLEMLRQMRSLRRARAAGAPQGETATLPGGLVAFFTNQDFAGVPQYRLTAQRIARLAQLSEQCGALFVLGGAPQREEVDPETQAWWSTHTQLGAGRLDFDGARRYLDWVSMQLGTPRFDPIPAFRSHLAQDRDYWFREDGHLNVRGHHLMGETLADEIEKLAAFRQWRERRR